jgi:hypothetical protein
MSTRSISTKIKKKTISNRRNATIDTQFLGNEPILESLSGRQDPRLTSVLNWYNYMYDASKAKQWLLQYLKIEGRADLIQIVKSIPDKLVSTTPGWLAKMSLNGTKLAAENKEWIVSRIEEMGAKRLRLDEEVSEDPLQPKAKVPVDIQARTKIKNDNLLSDAEEQVIDNRGSMYDFLQKYVATPAAARYLLQYYQPIYDEVMSEDEQVIEAFGKKLKAERTFMQTLIDDLNRYIGNKKATKIRKAPTRKEKPLAKQIEKLKFQKEFAPLKIVSVNPVEIVGCQQLWTYNTKYKKLTRYDALGPAGIQVKGTTLIGYDVEKSLTKGLRKPDVTIQSLLAAGKISLRKLMDELKTTETKPNGRINTDTILLRVIK